MTKYPVSLSAVLLTVREYFRESKARMLEEGKLYSFRVDKRLSMPDGEYFVLVDTEDKRYLMEARHYKEYSIVPGNIITCRLDKINCSGKLFLEPEHPYYKQGDKDIFEVIGREERTKRKTGESVNVVLMKNNITQRAAIFENPHFLELLQGQKILCRVLLCRKGEVRLEAIAKI